MGDAAAVRSATCGSWVAMRVTLDEAGRVATVEQAVEACAFGQAAAASSPGLAVLDPARARRGRHGAILLPFRALIAAIGETAR